jgi:predicted DNA-binding transcriptional regulator AlpA
MKSRHRKQKPTKAVDQLDLFARAAPPVLPTPRTVAAPSAPVEQPPLQPRSTNVPEALIDYVLGSGRQRGRPEKMLNVVGSTASERRLLDVREAAARLGLSKSTLDKMRCIGRGPRFIRATDRAIRYDPADLDAFANERRRRSTSEDAFSALGA